MAGEKRVLAVESDRADAALDDIRVKFDAAVVKKTGEPVPVVQAVAEFLGDLGLAIDARQLLLEPRPERHDERLALLLAHPATRVGAQAPDRLLDRIEHGDPFERFVGDRSGAFA